MKHRLFCLLACSTLGAAGAAQAAPYHPSGTNLGYGNISHTQGVLGTVTNPASAAALPPGTSFGILSSVGVGYELAGDADEFVDSFETFVDDFDEFDRFLGRIEDGDLDEEADPLRFLIDGVGTAQDVEFAGNRLVQSLGDDAPSLGVTGGVHAPLAPLVVNHDRLGGALSLDVGGTFSGRLAVQAQGGIETGFGDFPLNIGDWSRTAADDGFEATGADGTLWELGDDGSVQKDGNDADDDFDVEIDVFSSIEAAAIKRFSLGYSARAHVHRDGTLYIGGTANYYSAEMARAAGDVLDDDEDDAVERILDDFSDNRQTENDFGVDLGVLWVARNFQAGLTGRNLNEPSFDYPDLDNFDELQATFGDDPRIPESKSYTMERQFTAEAALFTPNRRWMVGISHDLNSVDGPHGPALDNEYQWTTVGVGYSSASYFIPGFRLGYRTNNVGSELSYVTGGLTLFRMLNIDAAVSTDDVEEDGSSVPRSAIVNIGLEFPF